MIVVLRWLARRGLLDSTTAADMRTWRGTGGFASHLRCSVSSTAIDGPVRIEGEDWAGLERLVRYCSRGPLALERLHAPAGLEALSSPEARLVYRLPEPDMHGRHELRLTPLELLQGLARLVPPPRIHQHRYHGVLAPNARLRASVVSMGRPMLDESEDHLVHHPPLHHRAHPPPSRSAASALPRVPRSRPSPGRTPLRPVPGL